jgi:hypothetical protein
VVWSKYKVVEDFKPDHNLKRSKVVWSKYKVVEDFK